MKKMFSVIYVMSMVMISTSVFAEDPKKCLKDSSNEQILIDKTEEYLVRSQAIEAERVRRMHNTVGEKANLKNAQVKKAIDDAKKAQDEAYSEYQQSYDVLTTDCK